MVINNFLDRFVPNFLRFPCRFWKCSFHFSSFSCWLAAFSFALKVFFLPLTSFTVCHANYDCLSSTKFLILLIWPRIILFVYVSSLCTFLSFCELAFVGFLLLSKGVFFYIILFFLTATDFNGTLHLALGLVGMHSTAASLWAVTKFSYSSYGVCLSDMSWRLSNLFLTIIIYWLLIILLVSEDQS